MIKRDRFALLLAGLALYLVIGSPAAAVNFLANCSPNGITLGSEMVIGYHDPTGPLTPVVIPPPAPFANVVHTIPPTVLIIPSVASSGIVTAGPILKLPLGGGAAKDLVEGKVTSEFEYAATVGTLPLDGFRLRAVGSGSAVAALDFIGAPADAYVQGRATADFFNDLVPAGSPGPPPPDCNGSIFLPPLRPLAPYEVTLAVTVLQGFGGPMVVIHTQLPGSPAVTLPLAPGAFYRLVLDYKLRVPHGFDPPFDADISIDVAEALPAPGLSPFGLALLVLVVFAAGGGMLVRGRAMIR